MIIKLSDNRPETLQAVLDQLKKDFSADDLFGYIENDGEVRFTADQVLAQFDRAVEEELRSQNTSLT